MVALREDPAVAAGDDRELDDRRLLVGRWIERVERHVPLERDAADDPVAQVEVPRDDPVRTVRADDDVRADRRRRRRAP